MRPDEIRRPTVIEATPFATTETKQRINGELAAATVKAVASKGELDTLRGLRTKDGNLGKLEEALTYDAARVAYREHLNKLADHVANGDTTKFNDADGWTATDWQEDFSERRRVVRQHRAEIALQAWPVAKAIRARWAAAALDLAREIEVQERAVAERFAVQYSPSAVVLAIHKAAAEMADTSQAPCGCASIDTMVPFLTL